MSSKSEIRQMTTAELKSWLNTHNQRLPGDRRSKTYYLERALKLFEKISNESDSDNYNNNDTDGYNSGHNSTHNKSDAENTPLRQALLRRRSAVQEGSGGSGSSKKRGVTSRVRTRSRTSNNSNNSNSRNNSRSRSNSRSDSKNTRSRRMSSNTSNSNNNESESVNIGALTKDGKKIVKIRRKTPVRRSNTNSNNSSNVASGSLKKKYAVTMRTTQVKGSPSNSVSNSIKKKRNRMRRATDDPQTLRNTSNKMEFDDEDEQNDANDVSESDDENVPRYWIDFDPASKTIQELKQWLTSHNIAIPPTSERKVYYVNLVSKYSKLTKDDTSLPINDKNTKKRVLSPNQKKSYISPAKRIKKNTKFENDLNESPPLPPNINFSPLTPPDEKVSNQKIQRQMGKRVSLDSAFDNIKNTHTNDYNINNNNNNNVNYRKRGLLTTPAILKTATTGISDSTRASMRNEIQQMFESESENEDSNDIISKNNKNRINTKTKEEEEQEEDEITKKTRYNTMLNQFLASRAFDDELEKRKKRVKVRKSSLRSRKKSPKKDEFDNNNNNNNNVKEAQIEATKEKEKEKEEQAKGRKFESPFGMFGSIMNRFSPAFGGNNKKQSVLKNNNMSVKNKLNYENDNNMNHSDSEDAMSPLTGFNINNTNGTNNNFKNKNKNYNFKNENNKIERINLIEKNLLRDNEEDINTDPESVSPFFSKNTNVIDNNNNNINVNNRNYKNINEQQNDLQFKRSKVNKKGLKKTKMTKNVNDNVLDQNNLNSMGLNQNYHMQQQHLEQQQLQQQLQQQQYSQSQILSQSHSQPQNELQHKNDLKRKKQNVIKKFGSFLFAIFGIVIIAILTNYFLKQFGINFSNSENFTNLINFWQFEKEFAWFCDSGKTSVNFGNIERKYNEIGELCYMCPNENVEYCANGRIVCKEHYILSGKKCVLDSKRLQTALEIENYASKILSIYKGRADCGEMIDPGLNELALRAQIRHQLSRITDEVFEDGWKYFISNVVSESGNIEFNELNKRFYGKLSRKGIICQTKHFLWENIIYVCVILCILIFIFYWSLKYRENKLVYEISKLMRDYTFELLKEEKLKNPSYKAVSQLKQDNMNRFDKLLGTNENRKERIWNIVKDRFERDAYIQCSQRTIDGIQKLCWQLSDTYLKTNNILNNETNNTLNYNNNNGINSNINNNIHNNNQFDTQNISNSHYNGFIRNIGSNMQKTALKLVENTPLFGMKTKSRRDVNYNQFGASVNQNDMHLHAPHAPQAPQSPSNVYSVPIAREPRHSVTSPSRSFGVTPAVPRSKPVDLYQDEEEQYLQQQPNVPIHSKNVWNWG